MCNLHSCGKVKVTGDFVKVSQLLTACCRFIYTWLILVGEVFVLGKDLVGKTVTGRPIFVELQERHHSVAHWRGGSRIKKKSFSQQQSTKQMHDEGEIQSEEHEYSLNTEAQMHSDSIHNRVYGWDATDVLNRRLSVLGFIRTDTQRGSDAHTHYISFYRNRKHHLHWARTKE